METSGEAPRAPGFSREVAISFRDQLREARSKTQADAEAFEQIIFVVERLGCYLRKKQGDLGKYEKYVMGLAGCSPLCCDVPEAFRDLHIPFPILYERLREARNSAMHGGAAVRYAAAYAVELALVLEDALTSNYDRVSDYMVRNVICAELWQPLSFIRQAMLLSSFSCLPVNRPTEGKRDSCLVSDEAMARYLRVRSSDIPVKQLLVQPLEDAVKTGALGLVSARTCRATDSVKELVSGWSSRAVLVTRPETEELLGILTPYDLL